VPSTLVSRLDEALEETDLAQNEAARVLGTNPRTLGRWLRNEASPRSESRERVLELLAVLERIKGVLRPEAAHDWLFMPNAALSHNKPSDMLHDGQYREVLGAIDALGEGVFV
jgi:putative toxin-antitoxin system antitoxin component (TIGR02293 family)